MGVAVSSWHLAKTVSTAGQLGVVSGTALDIVLVRRLQQGDPGGDVRRALAAFPNQEVAERIRDLYFVEGGVPEGRGFATAPMFTVEPKLRSVQLAVLAGFVEVYLAKEGHDGVVGINFLEKIQLPTPATLYGSLLAGVDVVLVGAGIPRDIPGLIEALTEGRPAELPLHVGGADGDKVTMVFDPRQVVPDPPDLARPVFLAIVASAALATSLARKTAGVDGFVVEGPTAGGHNAPPRGPLTLEGGEPVYGPRDEVDLSRIRELGLPFWLAGSFATPDMLREAWAQGAAGIQAGTVFAFCRESGMDPAIRTKVLADVRAGTGEIFTDPLASPTGFPFKVVTLEDSLSQEDVYVLRDRICDLGYLREVYREEDGTLGYRCPAEPVKDFVAKGGAKEDTVGRKCVCNGLMATIGIPQTRRGQTEPPIVTAGEDVLRLARLLPDDGDGYGAADVISYLLDGATT
jgi:nitronate monooxygenase